MSEQHPLSNELSFEFYNFHKCNQLSLTFFFISVRCQCGNLSLEGKAVLRKEKKPMMKNLHNLKSMNRRSERGKHKKVGQLTDHGFELNL